MTWEFRLRQVWTIARLELGRVFFSRRGFWVYLLALFPLVIFIGHGIDVKIDERRWSDRAIPPAVADSFQEGETAEQILARAPTPINDHTFRPRRRNRPGEEEEEGPERRFMRYFDGRRHVNLNFEDGVLVSKHMRPRIDIEEDRQVYAGVFHYFYLRLAIFFGCLGIFVNLFRGEMIDKTLHFWFLAPVRRDVLLAGKYVAGLIAATVIFTTAVILCFLAMLWPQDPAAVDAFWRQQGASQLFWYAASAALGCVGYGSVFLASGLLLRNPMVIAAVLLLWEGIHGFLPAMLQRLTVIYYVRSLAPAPAPLPTDAPALVKLLFAPAAGPSTPLAVFGLFALTAFVLWVAARAVRRLEINYGTD